VSLFENLEQKAVDAISDKEKQKAWIDKGFDAAVKQSRALLPAGDDAELKAIRESGEYAIGKLEKHKDVLVKLGEHGLRSTISALALGDYSEASRHAALVSLGGASWDAATQAIVDTAKTGNQAKRDYDASVNEIMTVLKDIGIAAAKSLLPILLKLI